MKYLDFLKDRILQLLVFILLFIFMTILFILLDGHTLLYMSFIVVYLILMFFTFVYDYTRRKKFYRFVSSKLNKLDKKYLITELINNDNFLEASIFREYLYEIDKSYIEELNKYKFSNEEFKEYIELWCHEIKMPIATSKLIIDNNKNKVTSNILEEIDSIESFVEQVLFYSRSENVEKDYIVTKVNIKELVDEVIINNKKDLINKNIKIDTIKNDCFIESDSKWLKYIVNQIVVNSVKYSKEKNSKINIEFKDNKNNAILSIEDNGIGINSSEIDRVFEKGFTGSNGRKKYSSTGMGLYLCKKLCDKLGHEITIKSKEYIGTTIYIVFPKDSMINLT